MISLITVGLEVLLNLYLGGANYRKKIIKVLEGPEVSRTDTFVAHKVQGPSPNQPNSFCHLCQWGSLECSLDPKF